MRKSAIRRTISSGISLIEVIACMAILAVMMVPLSMVMRTSRQAIAREQNQTPSEKLQDGSRWLRHMIADGVVVGIASDAIKLQRASGDTVKIGVQSGDLVIDDGTQQTLLMENTKIQFAAITQKSPPNRMIGLKMLLSTIDTDTKTVTESTTVVAITPQI